MPRSRAASSTVIVSRCDCLDLARGDNIRAFYKSLSSSSRSRGNHVSRGNIGYADFLAGAALTEEGTVTVVRRWAHPERGPWLVHLQFAVVGERIQCVGVAMLSSQRPRAALTQDTLRRLPLARLLDEVRRDPPVELTRLVAQEASVRVGDMAKHRLGFLVGHESRTGPYDDEFFGEVAAVYRAAPTKPTTAVAEHFKVPVSTAANWVRRARAGNHLAPVHPVKSRRPVIKPVRPEHE